MLQATSHLSCQVINSLKPAFFPENIRNGLQKRKEQAAEKKKQFIEVTQDIYDLITNSNIISKSKENLRLTVHIDQRGRALHLLNVGAKKRKEPERRREKNQLSMPLASVENNHDGLHFIDRPKAKRHRGNADHFDDTSIININSAGGNGTTIKNFASTANQSQ